MSDIMCDGVGDNGTGNPFKINCRFNRTAEFLALYGEEFQVAAVDVAKKMMQTLIQKFMSELSFILRGLDIKQRCLKNIEDGVLHDEVDDWKYEENELPPDMHEMVKIIDEKMIMLLKRIANIELGTMAMVRNTKKLGEFRMSILNFKLTSNYTLDITDFAKLKLVVDWEEKDNTPEQFLASLSGCTTKEESDGFIAFIRLFGWSIDKVSQLMQSIATSMEAKIKEPLATDEKLGRVLSLQAIGAAGLMNELYQYVELYRHTLECSECSQNVLKACEGKMPKPSDTGHFSIPKPSRF